MDLERDLFKVTFGEPPTPPTEVLLDAIRKLSYKPSVVEAANWRTGREPVQPMGEPPALIRKAIEDARAKSKRLVLVHCMGDS